MRALLGAPQWNRPGDTPMITAIVRYQLPPHIDHDACLAHFEENFAGLLRG